jgi:hypothetical protein
MEPDSNGWCNSYYGTWNINNKPKYGVHFYMLDEYIKKTINNEKDNFNKRIAKTLEDFNKITKARLRQNLKDMKESNFNNLLDRVKAIESRLDNLQKNIEVKKVKKDF